MVPDSSIDSSFFVEENQISPILPTVQSRELSTKQIKKLLDRLLQELDDQDVNLGNIDKILSQIAIKSNVDYELWSQKAANISLQTGSISKSTMDEYESVKDHPTVLKQLNEKIQKKKLEKGVKDEKYKEANEREMLLTLLHRERKLSSNYESLLSSYQKLLEYTAEAVAEKRSQTFGMSGNDSRRKEVSTSTKLMSSLHSIQICQALKERADALNKNSVFLQHLHAKKRMDMDHVRSNLITETEKLAHELNENKDVNEHDKAK